MFYSDSPTLGTLEDSHPLAYLASLPPSLAHEFIIAMYVLVATAVIHAWDVLNSLHEDYQYFMNDNRANKLPLVVYFIARFSMTAFFLNAMVLETPLIGNCDDSSRLGPYLSCIALSSTSLMLLLRMSDIYDGDKSVVYFSFVLWLVTLATSLMGTFDFAEEYSEELPDYCLNATLRLFASIQNTVPLINDGFASMAISFRLVQVAISGEDKKTFKDVLERAREDPQGLIRIIFHGGQGHYLIMAGLTSIAAIASHTDSIPLIYQSVFRIANLALINIVACRLHRRMMSRKYSNDDADHIPLAFFKYMGIGSNSTDSFDVEALDYQ